MVSFWCFKAYNKKKNKTKKVCEKRISINTALAHFETVFQSAYKASRI